MKRIEVKRSDLGVPAMAFGLLLSGCGGGGGGGGGGGVASTPVPTYTKLANLSGNQTFQSAGIHFEFSNGKTYRQSSQAYGSGIIIAYRASDDSYTLTAPDGTTTLFSSTTGSLPPVLGPPPPLPSNSARLYNGADVFSLIVPTVNGVALSYTAIGGWARISNGLQSNYLAVLGVPTLTSDMPKTGTANYQTSVSGTASPLGNSPRDLTPNSTATFSANFAAGTVATTLNLIGTHINQIPVDYGSFSGTGTITSGGPAFSGTLASVASNPIFTTGEFSGAFFGPKAKEMGYSWYLGGGGFGNPFSARGMTTGTK